MQEKSLSRIGKRIGLSQSVMSHNVKELENRTGVRLLDRTTHEVVPTGAGQQLVLYLERPLGELNSTSRDTGRTGQQPNGKVRVVASQIISAHLIPQCTAESHRRYPDIRFVLYDRPQQQVTESARQGDVDFGIVIDPGLVGDLQCEAILSEPFFLFYHRDSALAAEDHAPWQVLQGVKLVLQNYVSSSRPLIDTASVRNGIQADIVQEVGHPVMLSPMIATGIDIGILSALALPLPEGSPLMVKRITPAAERQLMLMRRRNRSLFTVA